METLVIDHYPLQYQIEGHGPNALVIGSALYYPRSFSKNLRNYLKMVFIDWRGFAKANDLQDPSKVTLDTLLDDIEQMRKKLSLDKVIVIGHSAHALLALEYAKKYPAHVSHVVMISISPNLGPAIGKATERHWKEHASQERKDAFEIKLKQLPDSQIVKLPPNEAFVKAYIRRDPQGFYNYNFDSSHLWEGVLPNMPMFDYLYRIALRHIDITNNIDSFHTPIFLALGRHDYIIAPAEVWQSLIPKFLNLNLEIFEYSGHSPQLEEPELFDQKLLNWLKST